MSEELVNASKERIADLLQPINGGVGEDVSYDESFEQIKAETDKLSSLEGESCNWSSIGVTGEEILQDKSKDFRVACYLAACKMREGTLEPVLDGFMLLKELTARYWDDMYPPLRRIRARAGMVGWMSDQVGPLLIDHQLAAKDGPLVQLLDDVSKELDADFRERFADHYPGMTKLRDAIRHLVRSCPKEEKKEPPKPPPVPPPTAPAAAAAPASASAAPAAPAQVAAPAPAPAAPVAAPVVGDIAGAADAVKALKPIGRALVGMGAAIRGEKPDDPLAYRLTRLGMWIEMGKLPKVTDGAKTLVPPPPPHVKSGLEQAATSQDWLGLLNLAEKHAGNFILWLDPHRHAATAMGALGALFVKAREELLLQLALHLKNMRGIEKLAFNDGSPYADPQTLAWIEAEVRPVLAAEGDGGGSGAKSALDEPIKEARGLALKGELGKAIAVITGAAEQARSPVDRFRGKLAVAQLCLQAGEFAIARGQFQGLALVAESHALAGWDPGLCAEVYAGLYAAHRGANAAALKPNPKTPQIKPEPLPPEVVAAEKAAFDSLCQLDPATALKLGAS